MHYETTTLGRLGGWAADRRRAIVIAWCGIVLALGAFAPFAYTLTYVNSYQLIGAGTGNNLRVREVAHVTRSGDDVVVRHDDLSIVCA